jgi:hypothetical protein
MAFVNASNAKVTVGDRQWSGDVSDYSTSSNVGTIDVSVLESTDTSLIVGIASGDFTLNGFVDSADAGTANSQWQDLNGLRATSAGVPTMIGFEGFAADKDVWLTTAYETTYGVSASVSGSANFSLSLSTTGVQDYGKSLFDLASAQTATVSGTTVDNSASTTNGGVGSISVTAASGTSPTLDVIVQHSSDGSTWSTLGTFTQATGTTSEAITVASGTTVNRYVRATATIGGTTPSFTFAVGFARL